MRWQIVQSLDNLEKLTLNKSQREASGDLSGYSFHMADVATDMYDREFNLELASNERNVINKIDDALKRLQEKTYGFCTECEKSIPTARLNAIPYAKTCLKCQEKIESKK